MKSKIIISIIGATLVLFIWNAMSWMVLPFHSNALRTIPDGAINMKHLQNTLLQDGAYHFPGLPVSNSKESMDAVTSKLKAGPRISLMVYKKGATDFFDPSQFIWSMVINLLTAIALLFICKRLKIYQLGSILFTCVSIALIVALIGDFGPMIWHHFPLDYTLANVIDRLVPFTLLGLLFGLYTFKKHDYER